MWKENAKSRVMISRKRSVEFLNRDGTQNAKSEHDMCVRMEFEFVQCCHFAVAKHHYRLRFASATITAT